MKWIVVVVIISEHGCGEIGSPQFINHASVLISKVGGCNQSSSPSVSYTRHEII